MGRMRALAGNASHAWLLAPLILPRCAIVRLCVAFRRLAQYRRCTRSPVITRAERAGHRQDVTKCLRSVTDVMLVAFALLHQCQAT